MIKFLWLISFFPIVSFSQIVNSECFITRWIELSQKQLNPNVFCLDSNTNSETDLFQIIKSLVISKKLNIYKLKLLQNDALEWGYIDYEEERYSQLNTSNSKIDRYFQIFGPEQDIPLTDEMGEPLTRLNSIGLQEFVYPDREIFDLNTSDIDLIKIKESYILNKDLNVLELIPCDIGFYIKSREGERAVELFWVNLPELFEALRNEVLFSWFNDIVSLKYRGFKYKQLSCDESLVDYIESKHPELQKISDSCSFFINV